MAVTTQEFILALKEADKVAFIKSLFTTDFASKVTAVAGKGLSAEDFTTALKTKLSTMEGSHFKGVHTTIAKLETAHPAANAEAGSYGYIKATPTDAELMALLDGGAWVEQSGGGSGSAMTGVQIKALYEAVVDTNVFDDAEKQAIKDLVIATHGVAYTEEVPTDPDDNLKTSHITTDVPMRMLQSQHVPTDPVKALASRELMTIGSVMALMNQFQTLVMKDKGTITDMAGITETGIYEGTDVTDSPITGEIMVMANKDSHGDFGFFLMGDDRTMHTGGKKAGGKIGWQQVKHVTQSTGEIAVKIDSGFTTIQTNMYANLFGTDLMDGDEHVITFMMAPNSPEIPDGDSAWGYILPHVADATGQPVRLLSAGLAGTPNGVLKLWITKKALVTIKKVDKDNAESDWEVTHVEIPANGGATHVTHGAKNYEIIDTHVKKTVGVGKDFPLFHDAMKYAETVHTIGAGELEFELDEGTHLVGEPSTLHDDGIYYHINCKFTMHGKTTQDKCFIAMAATQDNGAFPSVFKFNGATAVGDFTFEPTKLGYPNSKAATFAYLDGSLFMHSITIKDASIGIYLEDGSSMVVQTHAGATTFDGCEEGISVDEHSICTLNRNSNNEITFKNCDTGIIVNSDSYCRLKGKPITFTANTKDTNIDIDVVQHDGSFITDDKTALHYLGSVPLPPSADGEYKLKIVGGVMTWVTV